MFISRLTPFVIPGAYLLTGQFIGSQPVAARSDLTIAAIANVCIAIDPSAGSGSNWDVPALVAEGQRTGRLVLDDGAVLRGRVVVDGLEVAPGARVFVAAGAQVISVGLNQLDGTFVPFFEESATRVPLVTIGSGSEGVAAVDGGASKSDRSDGAQALLGAATDECPTTLFAFGSSGIQPPPISFVFNQNTTITNQFMMVCAGPAPSQSPMPDVVSATGTRSVQAQGGDGGAGVDIYVECLGTAVLTIDGELCNAPGQRGADAEATGADGPPCECGGDATAYGGNGGRAGHLTVTAESIRWALFGFASVNFGGDGGNAIAHGGAGGDCPDCGVDGGRGGHATAIGGGSGLPGRIFVAARKKMVPAPNLVLANLVGLGVPPDGGRARAFAGPGGDAAACVDCRADGGDGGDAGDAVAHGGAGGYGPLFRANEAGLVTATLGADGGDGGNARAQSQRGGHGGSGASCPCTFPGEAGSGGKGGSGGDATARGGAGGAAEAGTIAIAFPTAGWGGDAGADCGMGGDGGNAGGCVGGPWLGCAAGDAGGAGTGGTRTAAGGAEGTASGGANPGQPGDPTKEETSQCDDGDPGMPGPFACDITVLCCVVGDGPGCGDPQCEAVVCAQDPFCCLVLWDSICADLAGALCPGCGGSNCCTAGNQPGCDDPLCAEIVCSALPFCCEIQWDASCAEFAGAACGVCSEGDG